MRSEEEIKKLLLDYAVQDNRIRAVLLNGSRANPEIVSDSLQDFDIVYIVDDLGSFTSDHSWVDFLGERLITQLPDKMIYAGVDEQYRNISFGYLMLFKDGNRIDLTLFPIQKIKTDFESDSLTIVWLDKDNLFTDLAPSGDVDYHIGKPTEQEFQEVCNEFWWICNNVSKGLLRKEITYAKDMTEKYLRPMFMKMIDWKIGIENNFSVSSGKAGKLMNRYVPGDLYEKILQSYSNADIEENWKSLFIMTELFDQLSGEVSRNLNFRKNEEEQNNTIGYLQHQYKAGH